MSYISEYCKKKNKCTLMGKVFLIRNLTLLQFNKQFICQFTSTLLHTYLYTHICVRDLFRKQYSVFYFLDKVHVFLNVKIRLS